VKAGIEVKKNGAWPNNGAGNSGESESDIKCNIGTGEGKWGTLRAKKEDKRLGGDERRNQKFRVRVHKSSTPALVTRCWGADLRFY